MAGFLRRLLVFIFLSVGFLSCQGQPAQQEFVLKSENSNCGTNEICLELKVVSYLEDGQPVMSRVSTEKLLQDLNSIWSQCEIAFRLSEYLWIDPKSWGLSSRALNMSELPQIRAAFESNHQLLIVFTTSWGSEGNINDTGADAWTTLPGNPPYGAIVDQPVSTNSGVIAHEMGHYFNLLHVNDRGNLLSPVVSNASRALSRDQCAVARAAISDHWREMIF